MRALLSQFRQNCVVAASRATASSTSAGAASCSAHGARAERRVTGLEHVPCPHAVALDAHREVGPRGRRQTCPGRVGSVAVASDQRPFGLGAAVVEDRLADQLDLDAAVEAFDGAYEHVVGVVVGRRPGMRRDLVLVGLRAHRQGGADSHPAVRRPPRRLEDVGTGLIHARCGVVDAEWPQPEGTRAAIQQAAEHTGRVEARNTEPVDRTVGCDQRARVAVREKPVVGDGGERRWRGCALRRLGGGHAGQRSPRSSAGITRVG